MQNKTKQEIIEEVLQGQKPIIYKTRVALEDIHFGDTVYHVSYIRMLDRARGEWLLSIGSSNSQMNKEGKFLTISKMSVHFTRPALLEEMLTIETKIHSLTGTGLTFSQRIINDNDNSKIYCTAEYKMNAAVVSELGTFKPARIKNSLPNFMPKHIK